MELLQEMVVLLTVLNGIGIKKVKWVNILMCISPKEYAEMVKDYIITHISVSS